MGDLLFSPQGRINSAAFIRGGYILILISIAIGLSVLVNTALGMVLSIFNIVLMYAWAVIWIKRLHNGGKSGWMFFAYILLYVGLSMFAAVLMLMFVGGEDFMHLVVEKANNELSDAELQTKMEAWQIANMVPMLIAKSLASLITLHIGDRAMPTDEGDNQYGPNPG